MSIKGGYKLINLKEKSITIDGDAVVIKGVYESIESNYRKPCIITGLVIGGVERSDRYVNFRVVNDDFVGMIGFNDDYENLMIKVTDDDEVTIFNL